MRLWALLALVPGVLAAQVSMTGVASLAGLEFDPSGFTDPTSSMVFDGADDYVEMADATSLDLLGANGSTICAWVKAASHGPDGNPRIIDKNGGQGDGWTMQLYNGGPLASLWFGVNASGDIWTTSNADIYTLNTWTCLCSTVRHGSNDDGTFFKDGSTFAMSDSSVTSGPPADNSGPVRIGIRASDLLRDFDGKMAYVQVWSEPITSATTISNACYAPCTEQTNLIHAWTLTESGGTQTDRFGSSDGTNNGNVSIDTADGPPITGLDALCEP